MFGRIYWLFAFMGVMTLAASLIWGFRYDHRAPMDNFYYNIGLYAAFIAVHLIMTRPWFKKAVYGNELGSTTDRRIYIAITVITWMAVLYLHRAVPGPSIVYAYPYETMIRFGGLCAMLVSIFGFFEGQTFASLGGFLGVPGNEMSHSHSEETPLLTEGSYAQVRHPMYRAAIFLGASSIIMFPNAGQILWVTMIGLTFVLFIPLEEKTLLKYRGDEYREYMKATPYRLFKGIW